MAGRFSDPAYILHMFRRFQSNNLEVSVIMDADRGGGKSYAAISLARQFVELFGFVCPKCGSEFYQEYMSYDEKTNKFTVPKYVLEGKHKITCPTQFELNMSSGEKELKSGCGHSFNFSERIPIKWVANKFIAYDTKQVIEMLQKGVKGQPIIADEAYSALSSGDHNKSENKALKHLLTVIRPKNYFIQWLIPNKRFLDSKVARQYSNYHFRCVRRGVISIFEKDKGMTPDPYHDKSMEKIFGHVFTFTDMTKILKKVVKHPCYFDTIEVRKIPDEVYDEYEYYRNALTIQRSAEEANFNEKDKTKLMAWNLMRNWDRIKIAVDKSKASKMTYGILAKEIAVNPMDHKSLVSDMTIRNWVTGVDDFLKRKGKDAAVFGEREDEVEKTDVTGKMKFVDAEVVDIKL